MQGFGPLGLGIITVSGVPNLSKLRKRLLLLIDQFAVGLHVEVFALASRIYI